MRRALAQKHKPIAFAEAIVDNASVTTTAVDTQGWNFATIVVRLGTTDIALTALKVQESDASGSGFADIDGADFDGDTDIEGSAASLPAATDDDKFFIVHIDLRGRKRYLDLVATVGNGTAGAWLFAYAILSQPDKGPNTAAEMGADTVLAV
jgi:hypothetical protein